jgi:hypothetical protein
MMKERAREPSLTRLRPRGCKTGSFRKRQSLAELLQPLSKQDLIGVLLDLADGNAGMGNSIRSVLKKEGFCDDEDDDDDDDDDSDEDDSDEDDDDDGRYGSRYSSRRW